MPIKNQLVCPVSAGLCLILMCGDWNPPTKLPKNKKENPFESSLFVEVCSRTFFLKKSKIQVGNGPAELSYRCARYRTKQF